MMGGEKGFAPSVVQIVSWAEIRHIAAIEALAYDMGISKREALEYIIDNDEEARVILDHLTCNYTKIIEDEKIAK